MENQSTRKKMDADDLELPAFDRGTRPQNARVAANPPSKHIPVEQQTRRPAPAGAPPILATDVNRAAPPAAQPRKQAAAQPKSYAGTVMPNAVQRRETGQIAAHPPQKQPYLSQAAAKPMRSAPVLTAEKPAIESKVFRSAPANVASILQTSIERTTKPAMPAPTTAQQPRQRSTPRPAEDFLEPYYVPVLGPNQAFVACLLICLVLGSMLRFTPLGTPLGFYDGPPEWGAWAATMGDAVKHTITPASEAPARRVVQPLAAPLGESSIVGPPTITIDEIDAILRSYNSPAVGAGRDFYNLGVEYGIDPAYAVAFFIHESSAGTNTGWAGLKPDGSTTHNVGNIICAGYDTCYNRFRDYGSWSEGIDDWYKLLDREYINGRGTYTVEQIIPIYAPSFENNVPGYINAVNSLVQEWRQGNIP